VILPIFIALIIYFDRRGKRLLRKIISDDNALIRNLIGYSPRRIVTKKIILSITAGLLIAAFLRPVTGGRIISVKTRGADIIFILDASASMQAADVWSNDRFYQAKTIIARFVDNYMKDGRVGLIAFGNRAVVRCPLTDDIQAFKTIVSELDCVGFAFQGTDLSQPLTTMFNYIERLRNIQTYNSAVKPAVVLISDGESHNNDFTGILSRVKNAGIVVYTLGIGTTAGAPIILRDGTRIADSTGNLVISRKNEISLKNIAAATGGLYYSIDSRAAIDSVCNSLVTQINSSSVGNFEKKIIYYDDIYAYFACAALLLILIESML